MAGGGFQPPREITSRAGLIGALHEAAALEHGLLLQYIFAAVSMKRRLDEGLTERQRELVRGWESTLLEVARQEMAHLGTVCNLLNAIGAAPEFTRPNFPVANRYYPSDPDGDGTDDEHLTFALEPFSLDTVKRFVRFETPEPDKADREVAAEPALRWRTVGDLYKQISRAFSTFDERTLFVGDKAAQDGDGWTVLLHMIAVSDRTDAVAAIASIVEEGEGTPVGGEQSHWVRFKAIRDQLVAEQEQHPDFVPARPVLANPLTRPHFEVSGGEFITDPFTGQLCELHNGVYSSMLLMLLQYFSYAGEDDATRKQLKAMIRRLMSAVIRPLGEILTELPAGPEHPGRTAGPSFELYGAISAPVDPARAWLIFAERIANQAEVCDALRRRPGAPPRLEFVTTNLRIAAAIIERGRPAIPPPVN